MRQSTGRQFRRPLFHAVIIAIAVATAFYAAFLPSRSASRAGVLAEQVNASGSSAEAASQSPQSPTSSDSTQTQGEVTVLTALAPAENVIDPLQAAKQPSESSVQINALGPTDPNGDATPESGAVDAARNGLCETTDSLLYCVYEVQSGDTLTSIANKFQLQGTDDVPSWQLLVQSNKPDIVSEDDLLQIGQKLRIPLQAGIVHTVLSSETLIDIADEYGVTPEDIAAVGANGIGDADALTIGQELIIPNPTRLAAPVTAVDESVDAAADASSDGGSGGGDSGANAAAAAAAAAGPKSAAGFIWPATGPISSYFGPSHPLGIDIDLFSNPNEPIAAAAGGVVTFAGGNTCCSYGLYVTIDHGNGFVTLYAHMSVLYVSTGQSVSQGEILGLGGSTGYSTGNHLHFEVHDHGSIVNPLNYLP